MAGMKLGAAREAYYEASGTASSIIRQLGFAGIGLIFAFLSESAEKQVPSELVPAALLIVVALSLDFMQYLVRTATWGVFARRTEQQENADDDTLVEAPDWVNVPPLVIFILKVASMGAAYGFVLKSLFARVF